MGSRHRASELVLGLALAWGAVACSSDAKTIPGGAGGASGAASCDAIDYASYKTGATPSFRTDIMPIFGLSCTASSCHNTQIKKAGLDLGVRCKYDLTTLKCVFPDAVDPMDQSADPYSPLTATVLAATRTSLMAPAKTVTSASIPRVLPGDPEHSFLVQKVTDKQNAEGYTCTNADPSNSTVQPPLACGDLMPLGATPLCEGTQRPNFDLIARWIAQGAPDN